MWKSASSMSRLLPVKDGPGGCGGNEPAVEPVLNVHRILCMPFRKRKPQEGLAERAEDGRGGPRAALERVRINREQAELRAVAVEPLEVVEERPVKVARNRNARGLGRGERCEMGFEERGAKRIGAVGEAILGDENRKTEPARVAEKGSERLGRDLPSVVREAAPLPVAILKAGQ